LIPTIQNIPILFYHSVANKNTKPNYLQVSYENFKNQLKTLSILGFKTIDLKSLNSSNIILTGKEIIITFDDGYKDNIKNVAPLLREFSFKAIFFLVTSHIGKTNLWDKNKKNYTRMNLMNKNDISKLINNGHYIGSQGRNHLNLNLINKSKLINEISTSKRNLEKMFNCKVNFFAYAFGAYNQRVIKEVKKYYDFALTTERLKLHKKHITNYNLTRISVNRNTNIFKFLFKIYLFKFKILFQRFI
jgi:peptidoglycan/xylan/chitin deacetylase (PgdA/CDA1 family)